VRPESLIVVGELIVDRTPGPRGALARPCVDCGCPLWITDASDIDLLRAGAVAACRLCSFRAVLRQATAPTLWRSDVFEAAFGLCVGDLPNPPSVEAALFEAQRSN
jgi:hypothetical protein